MLEGLFAILIFSMGVIAIIGLQATSIKQASGGKFRTDAGLLANQLIGEMWVSDRTVATLQANFSSPSGTSYTTWLTTVQDTLPGVVANPPTVEVNAFTNVVTININWKAPNEPASEPVHRYTVSTLIR